MLFLSLITLIICKAVPSLNTNLSENGYGRITAIICLFCAILTFNSYSINGLSSGIAIYGGLFHITNISQILEIFLFLIAFIILIAWPVEKISFYKHKGLSDNQIQLINEIKLINIKKTNYNIFT